MKYMRKILSKQIFYNLNFHKILICLLIFFANFGLFYYDTFPLAQSESGGSFYPSYSFKESTIASWVPDYFGHRGYLINSFQTFIFRFFIYPEFQYPFLVQFTFYLSLFYLGYLGFYKLLYLFSNFQSNKILLLYISLIVLFNPASIGVLVRFQYPFISFHFLLPLIFYLFLRCLTSYRIVDFLKYVLIINLLLSLFSIIYASLSTFVLLFLFWSILSLGVMIKYFNLSTFKNIVLFFVIWFALNSFWLAPFLTEMYYKNTLNLSIFVADDFTNSQTLIHFSKKDSGFLNIFRLISDNNINQISNFNEGFQKIFRIFVYTPIIFCIIFFLYLLVKKYKLKQIFKTELFILVFLFLSFLVIIRGANFPFTTVYLYFFNKLDFLQVLRNNYEKGMLLFYLPFLLIFSVSFLILVKNNFLKKTLVTIFFIYLILNSYLFYSSRLLLGTEEPYSNIKKGYRLVIPEYYIEASKKINQTSSQSNTLVLPLVYEGINYKWKYGYGGVDIISWILSDKTYSFLSPDYYSDRKNLIKNIMFAKDKNSVLNLYNFEHVLFRSDFQTSNLSDLNPDLVFKYFLNNYVPDFESLNSIKFSLSLGKSKNFQKVLISDYYSNSSSMSIPDKDISNLHLKIDIDPNSFVTTSDPYFLVIQSSDIKNIETLFKITTPLSQEINFRKDASQYMVFSNNSVCKDCFISEPIFINSIPTTSFIFKFIPKENIQKLNIENIYIGGYEYLLDSNKTYKKIFEDKVILFENSLDSNLFKCYSKIEPYQNISKFIYEEFDPIKILYLKQSKYDEMKDKVLDMCLVSYDKISNSEYIIEVKPLKNSIFNTVLNFNNTADSLWKLIPYEDSLISQKILDFNKNHFLTNTYSNSFYLENVPAEGKKYRLIYLPHFVFQLFKFLSLSIWVVLLAAFTFLYFKYNKKKIVKIKKKSDI